VLLIILIIAVSLVQRLNRTENEGEAQTTRDTPAPAASTQPNQPESASRPPDAPPPQVTRPQAPEIPPNEPIAVKLEATTGPCSIVYWVDDETKSTNLFLLEGESRDLPPAQKGVRLSIGNRMTLKLKINQREATFPAELPKFKARVIISRDNIKTFFP
jgi:hypothetical protein